MDYHKIMERLEMVGVDYSIEIEEETAPVRGNALASGDAATDRSAEDNILADLESGNDWAWCTVKVAARFEGLEGVDYLGCCSYQSEADFRAGGYFDDMKFEARARLAEQISERLETLKPFIEG